MSSVGVRQKSTQLLVIGSCAATRPKSSGDPAWISTYGRASCCPSCLLTGPAAALCLLSHAALRSCLVPLCCCCCCCCSSSSSPACPSRGASPGGHSRLQLRVSLLDAGSDTQPVAGGGRPRRGSRLHERDCGDRGLGA